MSVWSGWRQWMAGSRRSRARIAVNLAPRAGPYGGGNQFVSALSAHLRRNGYELTFRLDERIDVALIIDGRAELTTFGTDDVADLKSRRPSLVCVHRVNECDARKAGEGMDALLARVNAVADYTVFVSGWLRDYHASRWFDRDRPHGVILSGADPSVFHPWGGRAPRGVFRVATHHWSDHMMKGFAVYAEVDRLIASGQLPGFELWVIGRWPAQIRWSVARLVPPLTGHALADELRQCHGYVTASLWEPGSMHVVEAAQCGLPIAYHANGGGTVEVAQRFGVAFGDDVADALRTLRERHDDLRARVLTDAPDGDLMCVEYRRLFERLLAGRADALQ